MRLIDADALCRYANNLKDRKIDANDIMRFPRVDAMPVVRCKDCKKRDVCRTSNIWATPTADDWFCADGERREDAEKTD